MANLGGSIVTSTISVVPYNQHPILIVKAPTLESKRQTSAPCATSSNPTLLPTDSTALASEGSFGG